MNTSKPGRPRSQAARRRILKSALEMLEEGGLPAVTMEGIAKRAGVGKPTIYRYWKNALAVAMTALIEAHPSFDEANQSGLPIDRLRAHLRAMIQAFRSGPGRSAATLIAAANADTEMGKAFRHNIILKSRETGRVLLQEARENGDIRSDVDLEVVLDQLYGPIFFRLLVGHQELLDSVADQLLGHLISGVGPGKAETPHP